MLSPNDFEVNETWVLFPLGKSPNREGDMKDYHLITLMDAASCSVLWRHWLSGTAKNAWGAQARRLVETAIRLSKGSLPKTLVVTRGLLADFIKPEAIRRGIRVKSVPQYELAAFTSEPRKAFAQKFEGSPSR